MEPTLDRNFPQRPSAAHELCAPERSVQRCGVCGFREVRTDEVFDRGIVLLAECGRCRHRWTTRAPAVALAVSRRRSAVDTAA